MFSSPLRAKPTRVAVLLAGSVLIFQIGFHRNAWADPSTTSPEKGFDLGELPSARAVGMAGAANALGVSNTALYMNPANLPMARVYHIEAFGALSPEARRQTYGASIADSLVSSSRLAGGLGGAWSMLDPDGIRRTWIDVRGGLAYPFGDHFSVGMVGRYIRVSQNVAKGPFGQSLVSDGTADSPLFNEITFDAGATVSVTEAFRIGVVGHNLTNTGSALAPMNIAGGLGYGTRQFSIEGGALVDFTTWGKTTPRFMGGAEVFLADRVALRAGYRYEDGSKTHAVTGGVGYVDRRWSAELGVRRDIAGELQMTFATLALRYFYDALNTSPDSEGDPM